MSFKRVSMKIMQKTPIWIPSPWSFSRTSHGSWQSIKARMSRITQRTGLTSLTLSRFMRFSRRSLSSEDWMLNSRSNLKNLIRQSGKWQPRSFYSGACRLGFISRSLICSPSDVSTTCMLKCPTTTTRMPRRYRSRIWIDFNFFQKRYWHGCTTIVLLSYKQRLEIKQTVMINPQKRL